MLLFCKKIVTASVFKSSADCKCIFKVFAHYDNAVVAKEACLAVANGCGHVFDKSLCAGECCLCARNCVAKDVTILFRHGEIFAHCCKHTTIERMGVDGCVTVGMCVQECCVHLAFTCGLV